MFDDKTQETLRRLLDLAEHPATPQAERALALARVRALVMIPDGDARRAPVTPAMEAGILKGIAPLTRRVDEDLVDEVHGDLYAFGTRYRVIGEVADEMARVLERWAATVPAKRHRHEEAVRVTAAKLAYLLQRRDLFRGSGRGGRPRAR
ncbi:hypothetical protein Ppa06_55240 [Planomonospora parontospora subsp. parontospora]|uniref:Uncharacterized protein n=2 Tax=Planomonospora parontospora TaxID=58119 RepID=A0AA37BLP5_9ACTN|nr:hypothetical protein [Planomonospora parontospora]GGK89737.1 hypothetical protein GCM10010126_56520 [Planomonospora parontospora]GII11726.1 hypothetical protein Ppa06_55240 [Planomonospora parontospora subsp. parontospora]